jgi:hypothetical protein
MVASPVTLEPAFIAAIKAYQDAQTEQKMRFIAARSIGRFMGMEERNTPYDDSRRA